MITTILLALAIAALVLGIVAVVQANGRSWVGWGVIFLAIIEIYEHLPK